MAKERLYGRDGLVYAFFLKARGDVPFCVPLQGFYSGTASEKVQEAWKANR